MVSHPLYDISKHRAAIDEVDKQIYQLLIKRMNLIHEVKEIKQKYVKKGSSIRPARAIEVIRNACNGLAPYYHQYVAISIWRTLISISEYNEQEFSIIAFNEECYWLGREFFGSVSNIIEKDIDKLIDYLYKFDTHFGFLPFPHKNNECKWWSYLINSKLKVFSIAPLYDDQHVAALVVGQVMLEPTHKNDFTLIATHTTMSLQNITGFSILDIQQSNCKAVYLVQVKQFLNNKQVKNLGGHLVGNYSII